MRKLRDKEGETAIVVPVVVRPIVVGVQVATVVITVRVEQVRIAVGNAHCFIFDTAP